MGTFARDIYRSRNGIGFFYIDVRIELDNNSMAETNDTYFSWVNESEMYTSTSTGALCSLNREAMSKFLQNYCPDIDFIIVLREMRALVCIRWRFAVLIIIQEIYFAVVNYV